MLRNRSFLYLCSAALTGFIASCSPENEEVVNEPRLVRTVTVEENQAGQTVQFAGTVESQIQVELAFRIGGRVVERLVNVGDAVKAGQRVARLDSSDEENGLRAAEASFVAADSQLSEARLTYNRQRQLYNRQVVARAAVDRAEQALASAQAVADAAQAQVGIARRRLEDTILYANSPGVITAVGVEAGEVVAAGSPGRADCTR